MATLSELVKEFGGEQQVIKILEADKRRKARGREKRTSNSIELKEFRAWKSTRNKPSTKG